jgi:hypothetical protein
MKIHPVVVQLFHADGQTDGRTDGQTDRQTDGETDMTELTVALRNVAKAPKNNLKVTVVSDVTQCSLVINYDSFGKPCCLKLMVEESFFFLPKNGGKASSDIFGTTNIFGEARSPHFSPYKLQTSDRNKEFAFYIYNIACRKYK